MAPALHRQILRFRFSRGAAATEYALLLGLIAGLSLGFLLIMGVTLQDTYETAAKRTADPYDSGNPSTPAVLEDCFTDGDQDSSNIFDLSSGYACFYLNGGDDSLTWTSDTPVYVSGGSGAEHIVTAGGNDTIEVSGANGVYEVTRIESRAGHDTIRILSGLMPLIDAGPGDDILDLTITSATTGSNGVVFHDFTAGPGQNHIELRCADDLGATMPNVAIARMAVSGDETVTVSRCVLYLMADALSGAASASLDLLLEDGAQVWDMGLKTAAYSGILIKGENSGGTGLSLPTDVDKMLGDYDIDLSIVLDEAATATSLPISVSLMNAEPETAIAGSDRAADIRIDTSPLVSHPLSPKAAGSIRLVDPQSWMTAEIIGEADPLQESSFSFQLDFASDPSNVSTDIPTLKSDGAGLYITIGKTSGYSGYSPSQCWEAVLHDSSGAQADETLTCGSHELVAPGYAHAPAGGSYVTRSLQTYDRLVLTDPTGHRHEINFNGNPGPGGADLTLRSLRISN